MLDSSHKDVLCKCKEGFSGETQHGKEAKCVRHKQERKTSNPLQQVQQGIRDLKFITAVVDASDLFFKEENSPCVRCSKLKNTESIIVGLAL